MTRQTSISAYHKAVETGLLSGLRLEIYTCLSKHGPSTQMEVCRKINNPGRQDRSYMPRFAELEKMGVITTIGEKICSVTKNKVLQWGITNNIPKKLVKTETSTAKIKRLENELLVVINKLKRMRSKCKCM